MNEKQGGDITPKARDLENGSWYWIGKKILFIYGPVIKTPGIAVYNALAAFSNTQTQTCFPSQVQVARICGLSSRTVIRKIKQLEGLGLIRIERKRKALTYCLLEPKIGDRKYEICDKSYRRYVTQCHTNKNKGTRINNENKEISDLKNFKPNTREELLAKDLAISLNDPNGFSFYLSKAKKLSEGLMRMILGETKETPEGKVKKSRGAIFNYLLQKYEQKHKNNSRD